MARSREEKKTVRDSWVTFRPEIKILDCSVRDGGLMNDHLFEDGFVRAVYQACVEAGVDYMEVGYKASKRLFSPTKFGPWKYCNEDDIRRIVGDNETPLKLTAMCDAEKTDYHEDILPKEQSVLDVIRVATYIHQIPTALDMVKDAHDKGYQTTLNLMAVSTVRESDLDVALEVMAQSEVQAIYLVDSWGVLYSEQIQALTRKYLKAVEGTGKEVGIHTHNNQQLAYANTIEALILGANWLDASICGIGRGAGNCPMELLIGFLRNPKFRLRPIIECIQNTFLPLRRSLEWGYDIPYMITGQLNQHPRAAMEFLASEERDDLVGFYDRSLDGI
jgi:4-hydroxy 2-oxovalerate aldolase